MYDSEKRRERYMANREVIIAKQKARNRKNRKKIREAKRAYYKAHQEEERARCRESMRALRAKRKRDKA